MDKLISRSRRVVLVAAALLMTAGLAQAQGGATATPNDTARFLAGMDPSASSPLTALTNDAGWKNHARAFDSAWTRLDANQLSKIRTWSAANLTAPRPVNFYMFSGPDFLYANAFFPKATTYVLSGLEPVGNVPEVTGLTKGAISQGLRGLQVSLNSILNRSFFITKHMRSNFASSRFTGTLPVLYVFLARSGHTVEDASFFSLAGDGSTIPGTTPPARGATTGVKISFSDPAGVKKTLYYFSTDISDNGLPANGFLQFCQGLGTGDSFLKSASYHMHERPFGRIRDFVIANSAAVVQDDSGIPVKYFEADKWDLKPFGHYLGPIGVFGGHYQRDLKAVFKDAKPIDFGMGYRFRIRESNLLLAVRKDVKAADGAR